MDGDSTIPRIATPTKSLRYMLTDMSLGISAEQDITEIDGTDGDAESSQKELQPKESGCNENGDGFETRLLVYNFFYNMSAERLKNVCKGRKLRRTAAKEYLVY